jgi:carbamoyltransferase
MKVLGLHDGHTATALLMDNGRVISCISEDRLNRKKEWSGLPERAIKEVLRIGDTAPGDVDKVVFTSLLPPYNAQSAAWRQSKRRQNLLFGLMKKTLPLSTLRSNWWVEFAKKRVNRDVEHIYRRLGKLGLHRKKVIFLDHHTSHAYTTLLNWWGQNDDMLILTLDASGDGYSGTVHVIPKGRPGELELLEKINRFNSIGIFYTRITDYLGMKPVSHEYKVMGMAGYGFKEYYMPVYKKMRADYFRVNGLKFENRSGCWDKDYLPRLAKDFQGVRFDNLCAGAQKLLEELVLKWVKNAVFTTGIKNVFCSGGVFMNVKVNQRIMNEIDGIDKFFVFPSCGDDSNPVGGAIHAYHQYCKDHNEKFKINKLGPIYWGPSYSDESVVSAIEKSGYSYEEIKDIDKFAGDSLAEGKVIARRTGRLEWGARALGNTSILADARSMNTVRHINNMIKFRDFWMPFAATILDSWAERYLINPKKMEAPYMITSFDTTDLAEKDIIAGLHPKDLTSRPQILTKDWNPDYYKILKTFEKQAGVGGLLNTSFNLHGDPIVCTPKSALYTFKNSGLDLLIMNNFVVSSK